MRVRGIVLRHQYGVDPALQVRTRRLHLPEFSLALGQGVHSGTHVVLGNLGGEVDVNDVIHHNSFNLGFHAVGKERSASVVVGEIYAAFVPHDRGRVPDSAALLHHRVRCHLAVHDNGRADGYRVGERLTDHPSGHKSNTYSLKKRLKPHRFILVQPLGFHNVLMAEKPLILPGLPRKPRLFLPLSWSRTVLAPPHRSSPPRRTYRLEIASRGQNVRPFRPDSEETPEYR